MGSSFRSLRAAGSGLTRGVAGRFLYDEQRIVHRCCLYLVLARPIPDAGTPRRFISEPRGRRSPPGRAGPGHVLIFSFKPVRRVHLDFATIR